MPDYSSQKHTPCFLHQLLLRLPAGGLRHVGAGRAVDGRIRDITDGEEIGSQASHAELRHIGERLAHAATKQEASQLFVQARHVEVPNEGPRVYAAESDPVTFTQCNLREKGRGSVQLQQQLANDTTFPSSLSHR